MFVIGIHAHINPYNNEGVAVIALRQIIGIAVPVFIALSGYFTTKTLNQEKYAREHWTFVKKHIKKLYFPYLIHGYVITAVAKISDIAQSWMLSCVFTLSATYFIYLFLKLMIPNKYHSYIGIVDFTKNQKYNESEEKL